MMETLAVKGLNISNLSNVCTIVLRSLNGLGSQVLIQNNEKLEMLPRDWQI